MCELWADQGRHQKVETHEAAGKDGGSAKGERAFEGVEVSDRLGVSCGVRRAAANAQTPPRETVLSQR